MARRCVVSQPDPLPWSGLFAWSEQISCPDCAHSPPCLKRKLATCIVRGAGYDLHADAATAELEFERLRLKQRRYAERSNGHLASPLIKMLIGDWYVDEFGVLTREIAARD